MMTLYFDVLVQNYSCLRIVSYFSSKIGLGEIPLVADFEDHATLYFDVLAQTYSCLRLRRYPDRRIAAQNARFSRGGPKNDPQTNERESAAARNYS